LNGGCRLPGWFGAVERSPFAVFLLSSGQASLPDRGPEKMVSSYSQTLFLRRCEDGSRTSPVDEQRFGRLNVPLVESTQKKRGPLVLRQRRASIISGNPIGSGRAP